MALRADKSEGNLFAMEIKTEPPESSGGRLTRASARKYRALCISKSNQAKEPEIVLEPSTTENRELPLDSPSCEAMKTSNAVKPELLDVPECGLEPEIDIQEEPRCYNPNEVYVKNSAVYITRQLAEQLDDDEVLPDCSSEELEEVYTSENTKDVFYKLSPLLICDINDGDLYSVIARCDSGVPPKYVKRLVKKASDMLPLSCFMKAMAPHEAMLMRIRSVKVEETQQQVPMFVVTHWSSPRSNFLDRPVRQSSRKASLRSSSKNSPVLGNISHVTASCSKKTTSSSQSEPSAISKQTIVNSQPSKSSSSLGITGQPPYDPKNSLQLEAAKQNLTNGSSSSPVPLYHIADRRRKSQLQRNARSSAAVGQDRTKFNHTCGECFMKFISYKAHLVHLHFHVYGRFRCEECTFTCTTRQEGVRHMDQHDPSVRPFLCRLCNRASFHDLSKYLAHFLSHTDRFPAKATCGICGASVKRYALHRHMFLRHQSLRRCHCKHCGRGFPTKAALASHAAHVHFRPKRHACDLCGKAYVQKCSLDYHIRTHSENQKPFRCNLCSRAFPAKMTLLSHKRKKHHENDSSRRRGAVVCMSCGDAFETVLEVQMHTCPNRVASFSAALASSRVETSSPMVAEVSAKDSLAQKMLLNLRSAIGSAIASGKNSKF